jgi:Homing endonuclease associated repeat/HNH endonuclease
MEFQVKMPNTNASDDEMLEDLRRVAHILSKSIITQKEYENLGKYSYSSYRNHFGTWKVALSKAGLKTSRNWGTSREEYLENLKEVWVKLGRQPKYTDMIIPFSKLSATAYAHFFGSWTNTLTEFQKYLNEAAIDTEATIENIKPERSNGHKTQRSVNWRLRFKVMQSDNFKCRFCGRAPAVDPTIILHVDHIRPYSKGGETILENLQTLCSVCNIGKSNEI